MVKTYGLTHIALAVKDVVRSLRFYQRVFGVKGVYRHAGFVQAQTPGSRDVLVFEEKRSGVGITGGIEHFGFRLVDPADVGAAARAVRRAGGEIVSQGEFCPGEPYLFVRDPDGYLVEIWYELPTSIDPKPPTFRTSRAAGTRGASVASKKPTQQTGSARARRR